MNDLIDIIRQLLGEPETPTLEFKQQWYWNNTTPPDEKGKQWGELIKDIIGLANAYSGGHAGKTRYLIIGANEEGEIFHIENNDIKEFKNRQTTSFHSELRKKLSEYTTPSLLDCIPNFKLEFLGIDEKDILVFQIPSPCQYIKLKKNLQTKTRTFDDGSVLVREGDSVKAASPEIIFSLKDEFKLYADNSHKVKAPEKNFPRKERSIQKTVDAYLKQNASYSQTKKDSDRKDNIIYEVFTLSNSLSSSVLYFVYIHENATQTMTFGDIKKRDLISSGDVTILTERPSIKKTEDRKINLEKAFHSTFKGLNSITLKTVSFIDEFGIKYLYKHCITEYVKYDVLYIDSDVNFEQNQQSALETLKMWYERDANPLLIIKGHGGIGKTTLVKHFLDSVHEENKEKGILFIDSNEIIDRLTRQSSSENKKLDDLFNFYQAQITEEYDNNQFTPDLFQLSIDNGSLLVVLDGIDEVIAKLGSKFNYTVLLKSIRDYYSSNLEKTKIIITCRESFLKEIENDDNWFSEVVLKPFDRPTAIKFFEQVFLSETKKTEKAMKLADKFANNEKNGSAFVYIPYTLDLICDLVREDNSISEDTLQSSDFGGLLSEKEPNDFIIGSICRRESKKLGFKDINSQIDLFIQIATNQDTHINICNMKPMWARVRGVNQDTISDQDISKLEGHPLLTRNGDNFSFKYDFIGYFGSVK